MNEQFLKRMQGYLQEEYEEYLKTLDEDAYRGLRVNTAKLSVDQFHDLKVCASQPSSICPESFYIPKDIKGAWQSSCASGRSVLYAGAKCRQCC